MPRRPRRGRKISFIAALALVASALLPGARGCGFSLTPTDALSMKPAAYGALLPYAFGALVGLSITATVHARSGTRYPRLLGMHVLLLTVATAWVWLATGDTAVVAARWGRGFVTGLAGMGLLVAANRSLSHVRRLDWCQGIGSVMCAGWFLVIPWQLPWFLKVTPGYWLALLASLVLLIDSTLQLHRKDAQR